MSRRMVIVGLDGADWSLLDPLMEDGVMPALKSFVDSGVRATLESVRPTNSMSAWTSFMTGVNPGKHGVFDFVRKTNTPFQTHITNSSAIRFPTLWETLGAGDRSSCVIDMPPLYPPFEINGVMLGGIGAGAAANRSYSAPGDLAERVVNAVGAFDSDVQWVDKAGQEDQLLGQLIAMVENRGKVSEFLLNDREWDVFCTVFVAPDRLQHVFWRDLVERGTHYSAARAFYERLDEVLTHLLDQVDTTSTDVLLVSDHGFRPAGRIFEVNQFLVEHLETVQDWRTDLAMPALRFIGAHVPMPNAAGRALIDALTRLRRRALRDLPAYSDTSDAAYVNLLGRETTGVVPPERFDPVREHVAEALLSFTDPASGRPAVRQVIKGEDYFHGTYADEAPDLAIDFHDGYAYGNTMGVTLFDWPYCQGVHSLNGIVAGLGPSFRRGHRAPAVSIMDMAPTILALQGIASPKGTDGRIAEELLVETPDGLTERAPSAPSERAADASPYTEEEEEAVRDRLRGLGYIE